MNDAPDRPERASEKRPKSHGAELFSSREIRDPGTQALADIPTHARDRFVSSPPTAAGSGELDFGDFEAGRLQQVERFAEQVIALEPHEDRIEEPLNEPHRP